jgi:hypothetical protein
MLLLLNLMVLFEYFCYKFQVIKKLKSIGMIEIQKIRHLNLSHDIYIYM